VGNIVQRELNRDGAWRDTLSEESGAVFIERAEPLLQANWSAALAGDHKATETCLDVLDKQARFHGLYA
jgi:hypothetical protein